MSIQIARDLSTGSTDVNAGFQFEFECARCNARWRSPFKPYRMGQFTGFVSRFAFLIDGMRRAGRTSGAFADMGSRGAKESAMNAAVAEASARYVQCDACHRTVCQNCYDRDRNACLDCVESARASGGGSGGRGYAASAGGQAAAAGQGCPNCGSPGDGGRFCAECGFDMASTHKSCPGCGTMVARAARFCTDCGHAF